MTDLDVVRRFHEAVVRAAAAVDLSPHVPELLVRFGFPGLAARLDLEPATHGDVADRRLHQLHDTLALEEARRIGADLDAQGIEHFFAKGVALLATVYRPGDRTISDLDLYVPGDAITQAQRRLAELGYAAVPEAEQSGPPALRSSLTLTRATGPAPGPTTVDLHWALDPVNRLLPRAHLPLPARCWRDVTRRDGLRVPAPAHHAALLVHHLVQTDLAHVRGVLDLALLLGEMPAEAGGEYLGAARELGVETVAREIAALVARDLGVSHPVAARTGRLSPSRLSLDHWLAQVARTPPHDEALVTRRRIATRIRLLGWRAAPALLADVLLPPRSWLEWRWPGRNVGRGLFAHYRQILRKAMRDEERV